MSDEARFVLGSILLPLLIASVPVLAGYSKWRSDRRRLSDESVAAIEAKRADAAQSISQAADSVIRNIRAAYDQALAELGVARAAHADERAARREVEEKLGKLVVEHAKVQDQLKVLNAKVVVLEDNNRQLRERVSALEADNHRLAEENRRLRESAEGNA